MSRRSLARRLNRETKAHRHEPMDVAKWLLKPDQKVTRAEAYALLRQWHYEVYRDVQMRRSYVERVFHAIWLIFTAPVRWGLRRFLRRSSARARAAAAVAAQQQPNQQPGGEGEGDGEVVQR